MPLFEINVTDKKGFPLPNIEVRIISLAKIGQMDEVLASDITDKAGTVYIDASEPFFPRPMVSEIFKRNIRIIVKGSGLSTVNYDYVFDPHGFGTHTTLQSAIDDAVETGARAIWVCTTAGTIREDISIPDTAGKPNDGAMFLIHTAPWSSIVQIEDPGELAPSPPRVRLQPSTDDTPAIVAYEPVQFQGFRIDNEAPVSSDAQLIVLKGANVIAEFIDCEIVQYDADKPVFSTTWDGASSCDVVKLENCIVRHDSGYYIMSDSFNLAGGLLMRRVSAYGVWNSIHAFRLIVDTSGFKANDADHPVFDCDGGYEEVRLTNCRIENSGAGGTFTCATGYANSDLHFSNTHFKGSGAGRGILLAWCHKVTVSGCTFEDFAIGVDLFGSVAAGIKLYGIAISDNVFDTCTTGINDGGNLDADELASIVTYPNAYYNCTTDSDFWLGPDAGDSSYTPTEGDDWPGDDPDDVKEALDDLADRLQDISELDFFVGTATGELSNEIVLTYARGSIIIGGASAWGVLAKGASGKFFKAGATDISWESITEADISDLGATICMDSELASHEGTPAAHHAATTLAADAQVLLNLATQEIGFVAQVKNLVLAGPGAGGNADPTFRALVAADLPSGTPSGLTPVRGSIIYGNATPAWAVKAIGAAGSALGSDGTDISWSTSLALAGTLTVDTINEYTGAAGVTIDSVLLKDDQVVVHGAEPQLSLVPAGGVTPAIRLNRDGVGSWDIQVTAADLLEFVDNTGYTSLQLYQNEARIGGQSDFKLAWNGTDPFIYFDSGDYLKYDRSANTLGFAGGTYKWLRLGTGSGQYFSFDFEVTNQNTIVRFFRETATSGTVQFQVFKGDGSGTKAFEVTGGTRLAKCYGELEIDGALNHDGSTVGLYGVTPVVRGNAFTLTNRTDVRTLDADACTIDQVADFLLTLAYEIQRKGLIA